MREGFELLDLQYHNHSWNQCSLKQDSPNFQMTRLPLPKAPPSFEELIWTSSANCCQDVNRSKMSILRQTYIRICWTDRLLRASLKGPKSKISTCDSEGDCPETCTNEAARDTSGRFTFTISQPTKENKGLRQREREKQYIYIYQESGSIGTCKVLHQSGGEKAVLARGLLLAI